MVFNTIDSTYDEIWVDKFGKTIMEKNRNSETPIIVRYMHEHKHPTGGTSNSKIVFEFLVNDR